VTSDPTRQFKRVTQVITDADGVGLEVDASASDDLRIYFKVTKTIGGHPNTASIKIYNLAPDTEDLVKGEFDDVLLNAGYEGATALLFRGNIRYAEGFDDGPERVLQLDCGDGDKDYQEVMINTSMPSGSTTDDLINHIVSKFSKIKKGTVTIASKKRSRGRVISMMAARLLDHVAAENDAHWSFQDGELHVIPATATLPNEAIVITAETSLLGTPKRTDKGIEVRCQLDPRILPNGKIFLDNKDFKDRVAKQRLKLPGAKPHTGAKAKRTHKLAAVSPDGIYKCIRVDHEGDTRSDKWESVVICVALPTTIPAGRKAAA
jgi:hypothetical protein